MYDVIDLINVHHPMLAFQEIKVFLVTKFNISGFTSVRKGYFSHTPHGGVAIHFHNSMPHSEISLITNIQITAVKVNINEVTSVCSVHIPNTR